MSAWREPLPTTRVERTQYRALVSTAHSPVFKFLYTHQQAPSLHLSKFAQLKDDNNSRLTELPGDPKETRKVKCLAHGRPSANVHFLLFSLAPGDAFISFSVFPLAFGFSFSSTLRRASQIGACWQKSGGPRPWTIR